MPKMKTKKAAAKRYRVTAKGKIKARKAGLRHILQKKSSNFNREKTQSLYLEQCDIKHAKRCLPYCGK